MQNQNTIISPMAQQIMNELAANKQKPDTRTENIYTTSYTTSQYQEPYQSSYQTGLGQITEKHVESISQEEWLQRHPETVKRSGVPIHYEESIVRTSQIPGTITMEEWRLRNPEIISKPMESITHEEWLARQSGVHPSHHVETITQEQWVNRQETSSYQQKPMESISYDEWMVRKQNERNSVPMMTITQEEWNARQGGYREENVKKAGVETIYVRQGDVAPYDYRDFRPREFNYNYSEYRPEVKYETTVVHQQESPVKRIIEQPKNVQFDEKITVVERVEHPKEGRQKVVILEGQEQKHSGWCC